LSSPWLSRFSLFLRDALVTFELMRNLFFSFAILFGVARMLHKFYKSRQGALPHSKKLNLDHVRRELRAGRRPRAMRMYRELTGAGLREARVAVDALEAELLGNGADGQSADAR